jgi:hypothetical protein
MKSYKAKYGLLPGTDYNEVMKTTRREYQTIQNRNPKRQPYVRSKYFNGDKVFINIFWNHLAQKRKGEQMKRAKLLRAAVDLLRNTQIPPQTIFSHTNLNEILHRFAGETKDGLQFYVQVKESKKSNRKDFMSVFPKGKRQK